MVVKLIKWPLWPPTAVAKKFLVKLVVGGLHGFINLTGRENDRSRIVTEVRWKGSKSTLMSLRKSNRTNLTKVAPLVVWEEGIEEDEEEDKNLVAKVEWNEEFVSVCTFTSNNIQKPNLHPWEIEFQVSDVSKSEFLLSRSLFLCFFSGFFSITNSSSSIFEI